MGGRNRSAQNAVGVKLGKLEKLRDGKERATATV